MLERIKIMFVTIVVSLVALSCVQDVILDARDDPQVVVECILSDEPVQTLFLSYTKGASREAAPELTEAVATLTDLTEGREAGRFRRAADGSWQLSYAAVPAHEYRLDVTVPDHEPIRAEQTMPETAGVEVGWHSWDPVEKDNNVGYIFRLSNPKNPVWFYGINYPTADSPGEQTEYLCTNSEAVDSFNELGDFGFGGGKGCHSFWGNESSGLQITSYPALQDSPGHKRLLRFPASENLTGEDFYVSGSLRGYISDYKDFMHAEVRPAELHYLSVSEDYDRFIKDGYQFLEFKASTDMADIFVRDNTYSNIHGAIGLLGAKIERVLEWEGKDTWQKSGYFLLGGFVSSYSYDESNYLQSSGAKIRSEVMLHCLPFELLHYEYVRIRHESDSIVLPSWSPHVYAPNGNALTMFYLDTIDDQEHLDAYGLGNLGEIDFSEKKVLVCAVHYINKLPILVGFGYPKRPNDYSVLLENKCVPIIFTAGTQSTVEEESYTTLFRCALLIDKDEQIVDPIADNMFYYTSFTYDTGRSDKSFAESLAWNYP